MNTGNWRKFQLKPLRVRLDKMNPRLPEYVRDSGPKDIRYYLIEHYKVVELAKKIMNEGFFTHRIPIAVQEGKNYIVIEGNRRTCAIQCILDPKKATPETKRLFDKYRRSAESDIIKQIQSVEYMIAPSRDAAHQILFSDHAKENTLPWNPIQKARFYVDDLAEGESVNEIAKKHGVTVNEVEKEARRYYIYKYACSLDLEEEVSVNIANENKFNYSTLGRIIDNPPFTKEVNVYIDGGKLQVEVDENWFKSIISHIVSDVSRGAKGGVTSRTINTSEDLKKYFNSLKEKVAHRDKKGNFQYSPSGGVSTTKRKKEKTKNKNTQKANPLFPKNFEWEEDNPKLISLIDEAKKIYPRTVPNACALLLRAILEQSTIHLYKKNRIKIPTFGKKNKIAGLKELIKNVVNTDNIISDNQLREAMTTFLQSENFVRLDTLHKYTHNEYITSDKDQMWSFWVTLKPYFELCLRGAASREE